MMKSSLTLQLIFVIALPLILSTIILVGVIFYIVREQIISDHVEDALSLSGMVSNQMGYSLYYMRVDELNAIMIQIKQNSPIDSVYVVDEVGKMVADGTQNLEFNQIVTDEFTKKGIISNEPLAEVGQNILHLSYPISFPDRIGTLRIDWNLVDLNQILGQLMSVFVMVGFLSSIGAGIIGIYFSRSITDRILTLRKATREIAKGNLKTRTKVKGDDELSQLANDINSMAGNLDTQQDELIKSERFSAIGELSSRLAHDLRNPLATIQAANELIKQKVEPLGDKNVKANFDMIDRAIWRISHQVDGVMDFVRIKSLNLEEVPSSDLLNSIVEQTNFPETVDISIEEKDVSIFCDREKLEIVLANLITNAIDAINKNGTIQLRALAENKKTKLEIEDSGPGIPKEKISKIFEPLFTTKERGTGLGLASCKSIVEQHGGTLTVKNNPTTFTISLPKKGIE